MRIRSIKPEFWRSDDIVELDIADRLLFIGIWSYVDDNGVGRDQPALIVADLFAHDMERDPSDTFARVSRGLQALENQGLINRYAAGKHKLLEVVSWSDHQRIDRPGKARYPRSSGDSRQSREDASSPRVNVSPGSGIREQGSREQGNKGTVDQVKGIDSTDPQLAHVSRYGIDVQALTEKVEAVYHQTPDPRALQQMADAVMGRATDPKNPTAVMLTSVTNDGKDWRKALAGERVAT